ncbi:hypothetical protein EMPS_07170 [Entomortierella parvispora]|uniref:Pentacotripeptide-repeat region of PRORP domain-containing protein n=1 Tax=Entomortierella parvispora TaxID=205924 RepID=A0A9P3LY62_9FUNG|nr:hypothetical protein EMPS_07170 [Entomortierella parvispora]
MTPAGKLPSSAFTSGTRALSTSASVSSNRTSLLGFGLSVRLEKAASWLHRPSQPNPSGTTTGQSLHAQSSFHGHQGTLPHHLAAAPFSTSGPSQRSSSSKEEDDLYQALTVSFRTRIAEQVHKPEDAYKSVIEHWTAHSQKDAMTRQRTRARKDRLAAAAKHKDIAWIQKEQERLELEASGSANDHFYIIQAWIKVGELKRATQAFEWTENRNIPPSVRTLAAMIRAHARSGNLAIAGSMVQRMIDHNMHPNSIYDLSALLEYYIKMTPTTSVTALPTSSSESEEASSSAAASGKSDIKIKSPSQDRVQEIWRAIEPQLRLSASAAANGNAIFAYRTYLVYLVHRAQDLEAAVDLIDKMTARNLSPELEKHRKVALALVQRLTQRGYLTEVQTLLHQSDAALGKVIAQSAWSELMEAYMARGENQISRWIYNDMIRYGIQPSARCKELFSALQIMGGTTDRHASLTLSTVSTLSAQDSGRGPGGGAGGKGKVDDSEREGRDGRRNDDGGNGQSDDKVQHTSSTSDIFSLLFNRQPKPAMS